MASNLFYSPEHRPDPAHWTRTNVGLSSPLWWPFLMAAGAGAAWWTYTNWGRIAANSWTGDLQHLSGGSGDGASRPTGWSLDQNLAVQGDAAAVVVTEEEQDDEGVDDGSDAIDAAYAANLGPVPAPKKRAATKTARASGKAVPKPAVKKTAAKTTAAKKTAAKKTPAKKTTAKKTTAKKTPAKRGR